MIISKEVINEIQDQDILEPTKTIQGEVILDITQEAEEAEEGCHADEVQLAEGIIEMIEMEVKLAIEELVDTGVAFIIIKEEVPTSQEGEEVGTEMTEVLGEVVKIEEHPIIEEAEVETSRIQKEMSLNIAHIDQLPQEMRPEIVVVIQVQLVVGTTEKTIAMIKTTVQAEEEGTKEKIAEVIMTEKVTAKGEDAEEVSRVVVKQETEI